MRTAITYALISILILASISVAAAQGSLVAWEVSTDFVPPRQEHVQIFLNIKNTGTEDIAGFKLGLVAEDLVYVETERLSFDESETSQKMEVIIKKEGGTNLIEVMLPSAILPGASQQLLLDFNSTGILKTEGSEYVAKIQLTEPETILKSGERGPLETGSGSFRIHTPEGFMYTRHNPDPWRFIWQGVSGFYAHYVLIFDGGSELTNPVTVWFKESPTVHRAANLYRQLKSQEASKAKPQETLDEANRRITNGANYVITGNEALAKVELDQAESILTGKPLGEIITGGTRPIDEVVSAPIGGVYIIGGGILVLLLVALLFGKRLISALKGGKSDEK